MFDDVTIFQSPVTLALLYNLTKDAFVHAFKILIGCALQMCFLMSNNCIFPCKNLNLCIFYTESIIKTDMYKSLFCQIGGEKLLRKFMKFFK